MKLMTPVEYPGIGETLFSGVLPNGLRICAIEKPEFRTCFAAFAVDYGGAYLRFKKNGEEISTPAGIAHYLEHKMFDMPDGSDALTVLSSMGANPNAFTGSDMTCYHISCTDRPEEGLELLLRYVTTPHFTEESVEKERGIISQEIVMGEDDPGYILYRNFLNALFVNHPIREQVAGTVESIGEITADTLKACYSSFYTPENMILAVEGNLKAETVYGIAARVLRDWKPGAALTPEFGEIEPPLPAEARTVCRMQVSEKQFMAGAKIHAGGDCPIRDRLIAHLAVQCLAGCSSPFFHRMYEKGLLSRDFYADAEYTMGLGYISLEGESRDPDGVLQALFEEAEAVGRNGIDSELFVRNKRAEIGSQLRGFEDFGNTCIALVSGVFEGYNPMEIPAVLETIGAEECREFIKAHIVPEKFTLSIVEPAGNGKEN